MKKGDIFYINDIRFVVSEVLDESPTCPEEIARIERAVEDHKRRCLDIFGSAENVVKFVCGDGK